MWSLLGLNMIRFTIYNYNKKQEQKFYKGLRDWTLILKFEKMERGKGAGDRREEKEKEKKEGKEKKDVGEAGEGEEILVGGRPDQS